MAKLTGSLVVVLALATASAQAQSLSVSYRDNLITIRCDNASLGQVFEQIHAATGLELFLEDQVKNRQLTANIDSQPLGLAVERLLAGVGVNYAMMYDQQDWQQVAKIFIGEGGGPLASSQPAAGVGARRPAGTVQPIEDNYDPSEQFEDGYAEEMFEEDYVQDEGGFDEAGEFDDGLEEATPGQDYLPPPPAFPRSRSTPGLETSPFGTTQQPQTEPGSPSRTQRPTRPPAYYPFTDQFGRPIPVPEDPNAPPGEEMPEEVPPEEQ